VSKALDTAIHSIKRDKFLSAAIVLTLMTTFLVLGSFLTTFVFTQTGIRRLEEGVLVSAYFKNDVPEENIMLAKAKLEKDPRVTQANYVSKEEAFKIFTEINKDDKLLLESVTASILPASIEVRTVKISDIEVMANELRSFDGVEDVRFFKDAVNNFRGWSRVINLTGLVLVGVFLFISFSVVVVALRLTISSKGTEISILRLVGASDRFIKRPLILQALIYSLVSAVIASIILLAVLNLFVYEAFTGLGQLSLVAFVPSLVVGSFAYSLLLVLFLIGSALLLGYLGSLTAIKKYLNL
jgi:cell division transport system permease protein